MPFAPISALRRGNFFRCDLYYTLSVALCDTSVSLCVIKKKNLHRVSQRSTELHREKMKFDYICTKF